MILMDGWIQGEEFKLVGIEERKLYQSCLYNSLLDTNHANKAQGSEKEMKK
jgi:hypothetical protein